LKIFGLFKQIKKLLWTLKESIPKSTQKFESKRSFGTLQIMVFAALPNDVQTHLSLAPSEAKYNTGNTNIYVTLRRVRLTSKITVLFG
jgi:hypothetical protein